MDRPHQSGQKCCQQRLPVCLRDLRRRGNSQPARQKVLIIQRSMFHCLNSFFYFQKTWNEKLWKGVSSLIEEPAHWYMKTTWETGTHSLDWDGRKWNCLLMAVPNSSGNCSGRHTQRWRLQNHSSSALDRWTPQSWSHVWKNTVHQWIPVTSIHFFSF